MRGLHSCEIKKSIHQIIQTAKIELPLSVVKRNNKMLERIRLIETIKQGDIIKIWLGYNDNNQLEFEGFITRINEKQPLVIECEDDMYLFRKVFYKKNFKKNSIKDVLNYLVDGVNAKFGTEIKLYGKMPELTVTNFMIDNANGIQVLQQLVDTYPIFNSYLTTIGGKKVLYCGLLYGLIRNRVKFELNRNTVSVDDLKYDVSEVQEYYLKLVQIRPDGTKEEHFFGNKKNQERAMYYTGTHSKAELKALADEELKQQVTGYRGGIQSFLIPNTQPCDIAVVNDKQYKREGTGYIGTVTTTFGSGARRKNEIDISL